jgi:hypothetical protein
MSMRKNQSNFQNAAFLLVDIEILIDFYARADLTRKIGF